MTTTNTMQQTYVKRLREKADSLIAMADWLDKLSANPAFESDEEFLDLMTPYTYVSNFSVDLTVKQESVWDEVNQKYNYPVDEEATKANIKKFKKACRGLISKEYDGDSEHFTKEFPRFTIVGRVDREAVCKPKAIEKVWVEPYTSKGYWRETVTEWDCSGDTNGDTTETTEVE